MILILGGIIVASVLVFIFILLMKYKLHSGHHRKHGVDGRRAHVCSQTNGGGGGGGGANSLPPAGQGDDSPPVALESTT